MQVSRDVPMSDLTTLRLGGPAARLVRVDAPDDAVAVVREADAAGEPVLLLGGGSNLVVADAGFDGTVLQLATRGIRAEPDGAGRARVTVAAGEPWDEVVARAVAEGWLGIEGLSGIPGSTGAGPIQNIGAYGQEVGDTLAQVVVWDRVAGRCHTLAAAEVGLGYRTSRFRTQPARFVVLEVVLSLPLGDLGGPVRYAELADRLGVGLGDRAPAVQVREAVLGLRRGKGMLLDAADHDTWSAGSFFTNPVLDAATASALPPAAPRWPAPAGVKTSAAWLLQSAGFGPGFALHADAPVAVSGRHSLALTNRGGATTADLLALARHLRDGVAAAFGVVLEPEPVLVGCAL